jgi:hypothetical protein
MGAAVAAIPCTLLGVPRSSITYTISHLILTTIGNFFTDRFVCLTDVQKKQFSASVSYIVRVEIIDWIGNVLARI